MSQNLPKATNVFAPNLLGAHRYTTLRMVCAFSEGASEETYKAVRGYVVSAQKQVTAAVNSAMVIAYWNIGKQIYDACGENERAEYGKQLLKYLAEKLTKEFGKGFDESNLRNMRRFYSTFQIRDALRPELSWTHCRCPCYYVVYQNTPYGSKEMLQRRR